MAKKKNKKTLVVVEFAWQQRKERFCTNFEYKERDRCNPLTYTHKSVHRMLKSNLFTCLCIECNKSNWFTCPCIECNKPNLFYMSVHPMQQAQIVYMSVHPMQQVQLVYMSLHPMQQAQLVLHVCASNATSPSCLHVRASNDHGCSGEREGEMTLCTTVSTLSTWTSYKSTRHLQYCYGHVYWHWINTYI